MLGLRAHGLLWLAALLALASAADIMDGIGAEWKMGLRPRQSGTNLQPFSGALGGASASAITNSGNSERPYEVEGDTFPDFQTAATRACDNQKNACAEIANSGGSFEVSACEEQNSECRSAVSSATDTTFNALVSSDADFDYFCDI